MAVAPERMAEAPELMALRLAQDSLMAKLGRRAYSLWHMADGGNGMKS